MEHCARELAKDCDSVLHEKPTTEAKALACLDRLRGLLQHLYSVEVKPQFLGIANRPCRSLSLRFLEARLPTSAHFPTIARVLLLRICAADALPGKRSVYIPAGITVVPGDLVMCEDGSGNLNCFNTVDPTTGLPKPGTLDLHGLATAQKAVFGKRTAQPF